MTERAAARQHDLLPATRELLSEIRHATGIPVELRADTRIRGRGRAVYVASDSDQSRHLVLYDPAYKQFLDHLVAHECGHIVRVSCASPSERMVPVLAAHRADQRQLEEDLINLIEDGVPPRVIQEMLPLWLGGIVTQVTNFPADIHIERWIHREFPALADNQRRSMLDQIDDLEEVLAPDVRAWTPDQVWRDSGAMNYAYTKAAAELFDRPELLAPYDRLPAVWALGEELLSIVDEREDHGFRGDCGTSDAWARKLGIDTWFAWRRIDELPPGARRIWEDAGSA